MSIPEARSNTGILYVRASLKPFQKEIAQAGGVRAFLAMHFEHDEVFAPYFLRARPFWEGRRSTPPVSNSGALGKRLAALSGAVVSIHPSHRFVGHGARVAEVLAQHDYRRGCFYPIAELAARHDFSMLLLGCCDESPGFSTVHATQYALGLSQKHLFRHLVRWDIGSAGAAFSIRASESPGCSMSFDKFYPAYQASQNLVSGELLGRKYVYVPSAAKALAAENEILSVNPRFVDCGRMACLTCRFRMY